MIFKSQIFHMKCFHMLILCSCQSLWVCNRILSKKKENLSGLLYVPASRMKDWSWSNWPRINFCSDLITSCAQWINEQLEWKRAQNELQSCNFTTHNEIRYEFKLQQNMLYAGTLYFWFEDGCIKYEDCSLNSPYFWA